MPRKKQKKMKYENLSHGHHSFSAMNITIVNVRNFWEIHDFEYLILYIIKLHPMLSYMYTNE